MRLKSLSAAMYGVVDYNLHPIPPVLVVIGPNASGKSVLLSLPVLALDGPDRGDKSEWSLTATWENDKGRERQVERSNSPKDGHKATYGIATKIGQVDKALARDIGGAWSWDAAEWLNLSARKRTAPIREFIEFHWDHDGVRTELESAGIDLDKLDQVAGRGGSTNGQDYIETLIDHLGKAWRDCNKRTKEAKASADSASLRIKALDLPAGTVASWQEKIDEAIERRSTLSTNLGAARQRQSYAKGQAQLLAQKRAKLAASHPITEAAALQFLELAKATDAAALITLAGHKRENAENLDRLAQVREAVTQERIDQGIRNHPLFTQARTIIAHYYAADPLDWVAPWLAGADIAAEPSTSMEALQAKVGAATNIQRRSQHAVDTIRNRETLTNKAVTKLEGVRLALKALDDLRNDIARLEAETQAGQGDEVATINDQLAALTSQIQGYAGSQQRLNDAVQLQAQVSAANARIVTATSTRAMVTEYGKTVRAVYGRMATEATEPLVTPASRICQATIGMPLALDIQDGTTVLVGGQPLATRSESQRTVAIMAFQAAVQMQISGWRALIIDSLEHIDKDHRTRFLDALAVEVAAGNLDNVLCACVDDGWRWGHHPSVGVGSLMLPSPK